MSDNGRTGRMSRSKAEYADRKTSTIRERQKKGSPPNLKCVRKTQQHHKVGAQTVSKKKNRA